MPEIGFSKAIRATTSVLCLCLAFTVGSFATSQPCTGQTAAKRVQKGLLVAYDFSEGQGKIVRDRSRNGASLDLVIDHPKGIRWLDSALEIQSPTAVLSANPARKVIDAIQRSNALSIEAWLRPSNASQGGPARIISLSKDPSHRNFTLGQDANRYDVRLRSSRSDKNGLPSTTSTAGSLQSRLTHVVFTRDASGTAVLFIDGQPSARKKVAGVFRNWDKGYRLSLADEVTGGRPWLGQFHLVAVYDRALSPQEVQQNFTAGASANPEMSLEERKLAERKNRFDSKIAPLLAKHCLECHDSAIKQGGLDLSRQASALAGGESGVVIQPGDAAASLLWSLVADDEMPQGRPPLGAEEKDALRQWIRDGAVWSVDVIDPFLYRHEGHVGEVWVQRLTVPEYIATVRAAVGVDISKEARELLPADVRADGFSNTAYNLNVDLKHIDAYGRLAQIVVQRMDILKFAARFNPSRKLSTDDTMRQHVAAIGKWLLRGPLDEREVNDFCGITTTVASAGGDFEQAMSCLIEAMLQSPRFLYRIEYQRGSGQPRQAGPYELASRLSYILWGAPPDEPLLQAAEKGELSDRKKLAAQVERMLKDPRVIERSRQFVFDWLNLGRLANLNPNPERFPDWNPQLAEAMRAETLAFFEEIAWTQNRPLSELLNAQLTFASPQLASFYGFKPTGQELTRYDLTTVPGRGGLLTQGSVLTIGGDDASMVSRGLFVLHDLLRGTVNAPPPCVNTTPPATAAGRTQRGIAESRIANENCGVCHARFEPLAFGLEKFDGIGAYHEQDIHGNQLRDDGEILFPGDANPVPYQNSAELMDLLAANKRVQESLTWKLTQFSLGRPLLAEDAATVSKIHDQAQKHGGTYASLLSAIVMSDLVQNVRTEKQP